MPGGTAILGCPLFPQSFVGARYRRFRAAAGKSCPTAVPSHAGWDSHSWLSAFPQSFVLTFQRSNFCLPRVLYSLVTRHSPLTTRHCTSPATPPTCHLRILHSGWVCGTDP